MKYLNGVYYVKVKDQRYMIHPTEDLSSRKREPPKILENSKSCKKWNEIRKKPRSWKSFTELELRPYNWRQKINKNIIKNPKFNLPDCPICRRHIWVEYDQGFHCKRWEYEIRKQNHQIIWYMIKKYLEGIMFFLQHCNMLIWN